jgi:uncharacterized alkaline shock family protein YloU
MKIVNVFAQLFAIFSFLTMGSLLVIVALHILSVEDAIVRVRELYDYPWRSVQTGFLGLFFISTGLIFAKMLLKAGRQTEAVIFQSEIGPMIVSVNAIEDVVKKVLKHFHLIKDARIKTIVHGKNVELRIKLVLWSGGRVPELLAEIQEKAKNRVKKLLGPENQIEVNCDVQKIEDHEGDLPELEDQNTYIA